METKRGLRVIGACGRFISKIKNSFFKEVVMSTKHFSCLCIFFCGFLMGNVAVQGAFYGQTLRIGDNNEQGVAPYFYGDMDAAGYSDWIWYGPSPIHDHDYHELLSGEWGAAIYYDGIDTELTADPNDAANRRQAMWLTTDYVFPGFPTNSDFVFGGTCAAQQDPINPSPLYDTGKSIIYNDEVEITIDYEVVDMNSITGGSPRSPMAYISDPNTSAVSFVPSDQYIFLQTYTIKNLKATTLTGLEFYQFLHSHGANEYGPQVNSTYTDTSISDPLVSYTPYDSVHQVGNFRYDITQWNQRPFSTATHVDFVSFSSTVEPNWVDNDIFEGHGGRPAEGTHVHIEERDLNDADAIYAAEVGGAMGWSLGSLDPNETASMTIAFMFAPVQESSLLTLTKTIEDANDCYSPGDEFTYTITWQNLSLTEDAENAVLTDFLPAGLTYPVTYSFDPNFQVTSSDPNYSVDGYNAYTWNLGTIPANSSDSVTLTVTVNEMAPPGMTVDNEAVLETSLGTVSAFHYTPICCWDDSGVIYVDENATGGNSGIDWVNAYTDLQDGLARARAACWESTEIRVAQGVYDPGRLETTTFSIPDNTSVYGGYKGGPVNGNDRDIKKYLTVLAGDTDAERNETVVTMGDETLLDGFTVTGAADYGIYGSGVDFDLESCAITTNKNYGVYAQNENVVLKWCEVKNNGLYGIYHEGEGFTLTIENSQIRKNSEYGIFCLNSTPTVKNSVASENDLAGAGSEGVRLVNPTNTPILYNNTFAHNRAEGVFFTDNGTLSDPNDKDWPDIQNCVLWHNNSGNEQFSGFSKSHVYYSCIYDPNDPNGVSLTLDDNDNFSANPKLAYFDPNNVHLAYDSPCKDAGSPYLSYTSQVDMDSEDRVVGSYVDIGADELYSCDGDYTEDDFHNDLDWNADGAVNLYEFSKFQRAWLSHDPNDPAWLADPNLADPNLSEPWNPLCNLDDTGSSQYIIDLADLDVFWTDTPWLWQACWRENYIEIFGMMSGGTEGMMMAMPVEMTFTESISPVESETIYPISELNSIEKTTVQILAILEQTIQEDEKNPNIEGIYEMKAFLEECLTDIRSQK